MYEIVCLQSHEEMLSDSIWWQFCLKVVKKMKFWIWYTQEILVWLFKTLHSFLVTKYNKNSKELKSN